MKKRLWSLLLALSLLFLASCGHREAVGDGTAVTEPSQPADQTERTEPTEPAEQTQQTEPTERTEPTEPTERTEPTEPTKSDSAPAPDYSSAEALRWSEHAWLHYYTDCVRDENGVGLSAEKEKAESTLYIGDGYSIYILADEWAYQSGSMGGLHADIWTNTLDGEEAELRIVKMDRKDYPKARAWVREQYSNYELYEDNDGGLFGTDLPYPDATLSIFVGFCSPWEDLYAIIRTQPQEAKQGDRFLYQMKAMIRTFQPFFDFPMGKLGRSEHMHLSGGADAGAEASLYIGKGYSLYLPDEGWISKTDTAELQTFGAWKSTEYEGVELRIDWLRYWNPKYEENVAKLLDPEYTIIEKGEHGLIGENSKGWRMEISYQLDEFSSYDDRYYIIYKVYPAADTEEAARAHALLDAVADTFEPNQNKAGYYYQFDY